VADTKLCLSEYNGLVFKHQCERIAGHVEAGQHMHRCYCGTEWIDGSKYATLIDNPNVCKPPNG
jgi:hypothetical protein